MYIENGVGLGVPVEKKKLEAETLPRARGFYGWLVGVQVMSVSLAVNPLILLIFSREFSIGFSRVKPLHDGTILDSPGIPWASTRFGHEFSFCHTAPNLPLSL